MTITESDEPVDIERSVSPFRKHEADALIKLKIGDLFPSDNPLAVDVVRLMAVDEDLANIERLKEILEVERGLRKFGQCAKW